MGEPTEDDGNRLSFCQKKKRLAFWFTPAPSRPTHHPFHPQEEEIKQLLISVLDKRKRDTVPVKKNPPIYEHSSPPPCSYEVGPPAIADLIIEMSYWPCECVSM